MEQDAFRRRKRFRILVMVLAVALPLLIETAIILWPREAPPGSQETAYSVTADPTFASPYEIFLPAVAYADGTPAVSSDSFVLGNATLTFETVGGDFGLRIKALGQVAMTIMYPLPQLPTLNLSRFPEGLPDFSFWSSDDSNLSDFWLGNISLLAVGLPPGGSVRLSISLAYGGDRVAHRAADTVFSDGWKAIPVRIN